MPFVLFAGFYSRPSFLCRRDTKRRLECPDQVLELYFHQYREIAIVADQKLPSSICARRWIEKVNRRIVCIYIMLEKR